MSKYEVRSATVEDAEAIGGIIKAVWPDSEINIGRIESVIRNTNHSTMVASIEGVLAGFVDGFMTTSVDSSRRWEVDLLAVDPQYQRRGIAGSLVIANTQEGFQRGATLARGLVAVDNVGSQKSFERCGYKLDGTICDLFVCTSRSHGSPEQIEITTASIFAVQTMNYSGLWIEGDRVPKSFEQGKLQLATTDCDLVGAVIPENDQELIQESQKIGYERVGRFQWWLRPLVDN
jgi:ribosomal protein S18 acetylase RimI-like enzyme